MSKFWEVIGLLLNLTIFNIPESITFVLVMHYLVSKTQRYDRSGQMVTEALSNLMEQIDENVQREIINHRSLRHPNIVRFKEVSSLSTLYLSSICK